MNWNMLFATKGRKIAVITTGVFFCLFLLYVISGFFIIPHVAKWQIEKQLPPVLNRNVSIEEIRLNPLTLRVECKNLVIKKKDGNANLFSIATLETQLSGKSIFALAPIVTYVRIVKPEINLTRHKDNTLSINDILQQKAEQTQPLPEESNAEKDTRIFPFKVLNLILEDGTIVLNDEKRDSVQTISKLSLAVPLTSSFTDHRKDAVTPKLEMLINGAPFDLSGSTYPFSDNLLTKFSFTANDLPLARYWRYVPVDSPVALTSGKMNTTINIGFSRPQNKSLQLHVDGDLELLDLSLTKKDSTAVLDVPRLSVNLKDFSLTEKKIVIQSLEVDSPFVEVHRQKDGSINWATYFTPQGNEASSAGTAGTTGQTKNSTADNAKIHKENTVPEKQAGQTNTVAEAQSPAASTENTPASEERPFAVVVESLAVKNGNILFKDSTLPKAFSIKLTPLDIQVDNFSTVPETTASMSVTAGNDKMIAVTGDFGISPLSANLTASTNNLPVAQFSPYLATATPARLGKGALTTSAAIQLSTNADSNIVVRIADGTVRLQNLAVTGVGYKKAPVTLKTLAVDNANIDLEKLSVSIGSIGFVAPEITLKRNEEGIDLISLFVAEPSASSSKKASTASKAAAASDSSWDILVDKVGLQDGKITFKDNVLKRTVTTNLKDIAITAGTGSADNKSTAASAGTKAKETVDVNDILNASGAPENLIHVGRQQTAAIKATTSPLDLSIGAITLQKSAVTFKDASFSPEVVLALDEIAASYKEFALNGEKASPVEFSAMLNGREISVSGTANPMASPVTLDLAVRLDDISLRSFSPYTVKHIAYPVETGSLNADVQIKASENKLDAQNKLLFEDFILGDRDDNSEAPAVPIKLGLSLLRLPNGNISLSLPISGDLDDPDFHLNQIIISTLVNVIVKAAISPFTILGSLLGDISPDQAQFIVFAPGSAEIPPKQLEILTKMSSVLKDKPTITVESMGHYNAKDDAEGLRNSALKKAVTDQWYNDLSSSEQKKVDVATATVPAELYEKYLKDAYEDVPELENDPRPTKLFGYEEQPREKMEEFLKSLVDTSHDTLRKLAQDRANAVRTAITKDTPELLDRVTALQAGPNEEDVPPTAVQLMLK